MDVCIKNVDPGDWRAFKAEAAKHGMTAAEFFSKILKEHEAKCGSKVRLAAKDMIKKAH